MLIQEETGLKIKVMKVVCISDSPCNGDFDLVVGEIYNVTNIRKVDVGPLMVYEIAEGVYSGYWVGYFIPISDIDETEFERNYKTETV